jgi:anti-anti-sigma regulatory factor
MSIALNRPESLSELCLEGAIDIASAAELKDLLIQALGCGTQVRISIDGATALDVTAVELLWAAEREAKRLGLGFSVAGSVSDEISATLDETGLKPFLVFAEASQEVSQEVSQEASQDSGVIPCQP